MKAGDRVRHVGNPEYGFGTIKLIDEDPLGDEVIAHVAFDWKEGTSACPPASLRPVAKLNGGQPLPANFWGKLEELRDRL